MANLKSLGIVKILDIIINGQFAANILIINKDKSSQTKW